MTSETRPSPRPGRVVTFGETMGLATSTRVGSLIHERNFELSFGGAESNVAIALSRLDVPVTWISRLGRDSLGRLILRELAAEGVDVEVEVDPDAPTGFMLKERRTPFATDVTYFRTGSAASKLAPADVCTATVEQSALLHVTGITPALSASASEATRAAVELARSSGVTVSFDLNYRTKLWSPTAAAAAFRSLVASSDVVFAGVEEAQLLFPTLDEPAELAAALVEAGATDAIIKQGADGCTAVIDGVDWRQPAVPVSVVDAVGAGDAFVAGYLSALLHGTDSAQRLRTAAATGAFACLASGDWQGSPTRDDLATFERSDSVAR